LIGIDLVKIERIKKAIERHGDAFTQKFLSDAEIKDSKHISSIAAKWAAKEAVSKALGCGIGGKLGFLDIEIKKDGSGAPYALLSQKSSAIFGVQKINISITHDGEYAVAAAFIYPPPTN
jgi:holo-[acyl-carrier protein] synthase